MALFAFVFTGCWLGVFLQAPASSMADTVRAKITWNKANDIDLHVRDAENNEAYYGDQDAIPDATLSPDITSSGGPETFTDHRSPSDRQFSYRVCYFAEGEGAAVGPTVVTVTLSDPGQPDRTSQLTLAAVGDCAAVGDPIEEEPKDPEDPPPPPPIPAPTANCDAYWVKPGGQLQVAAPGILGNDSDPRGLPLTARVVKINFGKNDHPYRISPSKGSLTFNPGTRPFIAIFTYQVVNSQGTASAPSTVTVYVQPSPPPGRIGKTSRVSRCAPSANRPPVAAPDSWTLDPGMVLEGDVLANDSDPDGDSITARVVKISFRNSEWSRLEASGEFLMTAGPNTVRRMTKVITYARP